MNPIDHDALADELIAAYDHVRTIEPISSRLPGFTVDDGYEVLRIVAQKRQAQGWQAAGRKIGFTNRTIWQRYGVSQPLWAPVWERTVFMASQGEAAFDLSRMVQPRIEPEVVFMLKGPVPASDDPEILLSAVESMAAGFEIVQSHYPDWKFRNADCTAAFGLHGVLIVGAAVPITDANRKQVIRTLSTFAATLSRNGTIVDRGIGANVLDSPALALGHLARVLAGQPQFPPLQAGELVSTGTITDAAPVAAGEVWTSDYGALGISGLTLRFT
jgi:2-oxo-3-hexenedioate decarboxylase